MIALVLVIVICWGAIVAVGSVLLALASMCAPFWVLYYLCIDLAIYFNWIEKPPVKKKRKKKRKPNAIEFSQEYVRNEDLNSMPAEYYDEYGILRGS